MLKSLRITAKQCLCVSCLIASPVVTGDVEPTAAGDLFARGARLLSAADGLQKQASDSIAQANALRDYVKRTRPTLGILDDNGRDILQKSFAEHIETSRMLQDIGSDLRVQAENLLLDSTALFQAGMMSHWRDWINQSRPLRLAENHTGDQTMVIQAHNAQVRSVSPKMMSMLPQPETQQASDMSLEVAKLAGQSPPEQLSVSSFALSRDRRYFAHIEVEQVDDNQGLVALNQLQNWRFVLSTLAGKPVTGADIEYGGHMPGHVHGLPTQPRVTDEIAPGVYRISGVKFQMRGWWVIDLSVGDDASGNRENPDNLRFNLTL